MTKPPKVMTIYGTHLEEIESAPVSNALDSDKRLSPSRFLPASTTFEITRKHDSVLMKPVQRLNENVSRSIARLHSTIEGEQPDVIIS